MAALQSRWERLAPDDEKYFALAYMRTERGTRLSYRHRPYLPAIMRDRRRKMVEVACAQSGKTTTNLAKVAHQIVFAKGLPPSWMYTMPTQTDVDDFSKLRAKPILGSSAFLAARLDVENARARQFRDPDSGLLLGTWHFKGTFTERAASSTPADGLCHDEVDKSDPDILEQYQSRTQASTDVRCYRFSTPSVPGFGISKDWAQSDQNEWMWTCGACGFEQVFAPMDGWQDWRQHLDLSEGLLRCYRCKAPVEREWIESGEWVPWAPANAEVAGYHITGIMPPELGAARIAERINGSDNKARAVQDTVGIPWVSGEQQIVRDNLRFGDWPNTLHSATATFAGCDEGEALDFIAGDGRGKIVSVQRFREDGSGHGAERQLMAAMRSLNVRRLVIGTERNERLGQRVAAAFPGRVKMAFYTIRDAGRLWFEVPARDIRVYLHRTTCLDVSRDLLLDPQGDVFPALPHELKETLVAHLTNMQRATKDDARGRPEEYWVKTGPDHLRHAHAYYVTAARMWGGYMDPRYRGEQAAT